MDFHLGWVNGCAIPSAPAHWAGSEESCMPAWFEEEERQRLGTEGKGGKAVGSVSQQLVRSLLILCCTRPKQFCLKQDHGCSDSQVRQTRQRPNSSNGGTGGVARRADESDVSKTIPHLIWCAKKDQLRPSGASNWGPKTGTRREPNKLQPILGNE